MTRRVRLAVLLLLALAAGGGWWWTTRRPAPIGWRSFFPKKNSPLDFQGPPQAH
jgi:hypothetical protein